MKKRLILFVCFFNILICGKAQITMTYVMDEPDMLITFMDISKYKTIDTSFLKVAYELKIVKDTTKRLSIAKDLMSLQIGKKATKFYSENIYQNDSICTKLSKERIDLPVNEYAYQGYEIFNLKDRSIMNITNRLPFSTDVYLYEEKIPDIKWHVSNEEDSVLGYNCHKAETEFRGRKYTAWFTTEIPIDGGPWKFGGLPGLILKVQDTDKQYVFECVGLVRKEEPINEYRWDYKKISKREWIKLETFYHKRATDYINNNNVRLRTFVDGELQPVSNAWKLPYNPLER